MKSTIAEMIEAHEISSLACNTIWRSLIRRFGYRDALAVVRQEMDSEIDSLVKSNTNDPQSSWFDNLSYERSKLSEIINRMEADNSKYWLGEDC